MVVLLEDMYGRFVDRQSLLQTVTTFMFILGELDPITVLCDRGSFLFQ